MGLEKDRKLALEFYFIFSNLKKCKFFSPYLTYKRVLF